MSTTRNDAIEALLEQASPRLVPPGEDEHMIRDVVLIEWQAVTGRRRSRMRFMQFAVAASVLLGVAVSFNLLQDNSIAPMQVATIGKSHGAIYVLGEQSQLRKVTDQSVIMAGQTIKTDPESGIGLQWGNGGSLRIAENTLVEFVSSGAIYLRYGRVYFDSTPAELVASISGGSEEVKLSIQTDHGTVTHAGTQYMTYTASNELTVSVREGQVSIDGNYHDTNVLEGQHLSIAGSARPIVTNFERYGPAWSWLEETSPIFDTDGRSVDAFLNWVSRETGLKVEYPDEATKQAAMDVVLKGRVNMIPREALQFWLQGQDLSWYVDGGTIKVNAIDGSSGR